MSRQALTGSRIRARRLDLDLRQADVARSCGISPAYLNLIEHNRRRIGGKLLGDLARALETDIGALSEGAEVALVGALRAAADAARDASVELDRTEEFAGRFPGWAALVDEQSRRIATLERTAAILSDRLSHDPDLSASLHDVITTVTAINATSSILTGGEDVDPEWQARFQRNIHEDSERLAEASQHLVRYLDAGDPSVQSNRTPQEELERWLAARSFHVAELERAIAPDPEGLLKGSDAPATPAAWAFTHAYLTRYRADAERVPLGALLEALEAFGPDPLRLAEAFRSDLPTVLRRMACLPPEVDAPPMGIAVCDGSGSLVFRKPVEGFALPRFGAACPLWPLYQVLGRPMVPRRDVVAQPGRLPRACLTYAIAQPAQADGFDGPSIIEATMLILPQDPSGSDPQPSQPVGTTCRVCPRRTCRARSEPSIFEDPVAPQA
ncbi:MAG: DUF2083 domain-containing protein [Rhodobacteraceae bacterium]|nr:DUF2083 domain-containing protein [Paracoccaceae bacterium]